MEAEFHDFAAGDAAHAGVGPANTVRRSPLPKNEWDHPHMKAEYRGGNLGISIVGATDGETLLEKLQSLMTLCQSEKHLHLDLSLTEDLDQLALNAVVVVLRDQGHKFQSLTLSGLPSWASGRLRKTRPEHLLGRNWTGAFDQGVASFCRC